MYLYLQLENIEKECTIFKKAYKTTGKTLPTMKLIGMSQEKSKVLQGLL